MSIAGAYWRGEREKRDVGAHYGVAFGSRDALKAHLAMLEEAKKRDHRRIGTDQELFSFHSQIAPQAPFFHPNGAMIYAELQDFLRDLNRGPRISRRHFSAHLSQELWKASGHYDHYRDNMYFTEIDERSFAVKPMNCPGHCN